MSGGEWTHNRSMSKWRPYPASADRIHVVRARAGGFAAVLWRTDSGPEDGEVVALAATAFRDALAEAMVKYQEFAAQGVDVQTKTNEEVGHG